MNRPDLPELVGYTGELLGLTDWQIGTRYVPDLATPSDGPVWGQTILLGRRAATILVRDPLTPTEGSTVAQALARVSAVVLHECVHIRLADLGRSGSPEDEAAVRAISSAIATERARGYMRGREPVKVAS